MRTKVTLTLLLLNVALFFWIFWFEWPRTGGDGPTGDAVMPPNATAVIDRMEVRRTGAAPIVLERRGEKWFLAAPYDWPANTPAVNRILDELRLLRHRVKFEVAQLGKTGMTLAEYGLENPALDLAFGRDGQMLVLRFGAATPDGNGFYVLPPDGHDVHVIDRGLVGVLPLSVDDLRTNSLIDIPVFEARALVVQSSGERTRVARTGERWMLESPIEARADKGAVELALQQLAALRVAAFAEPRAADPRTTGLDNPAFRLTVEGTQRRRILLLGRETAPAAPAGSAARAPAATTYFGKLDDRAAVFTVAVEHTLRDALGSAQVKLRDRHLLDLGAAPVKAIEIKAPGQPDVVLQRLETGAWQVHSRQGADVSRPQPADPALTDRFEKQLAALEAVDFHSDAPPAADLENWGFNLPDRAISLTLGDQSNVTLNLGLALRRGDTALRYARTSTSSTVYFVRGEFLEEVPASALALRNRTLRELPPGARLTGLALKRLADGGTVFAQQLTGAEEKWETPVAGERPAVRAAVTGLVAQLRKLRAREFVRDRFDAQVQTPAGPVAWSYELTATIELAAAGEQAQASTAKLFFSERLGGTTLYVGAAEPDLDCVFLAPQELLDAVFALTFGDRDPGPPAGAEDAPAAVTAGTTAPATVTPPVEKK